MYLPLENPFVVSEFGDYLNDRNSTDPQYLHAGVDFHSKNPTVYAPEKSLVYKISDCKKGEGLGGYGPHAVILQTTKDIFLLLAHLKEVSPNISEGQELQGGASIGKIGDVDKSHLHFEIRTQPFPVGSKRPWQVSLDPIQYLLGNRVTAQELDFENKRNNYPFKLKGEKKMPDKVDYELPDITLTTEKPEEIPIWLIAALGIGIYFFLSR